MTNFKYDTYYDYETYTQKLETLQQLYPQIFKIDKIAETKENRNIWAITISEDLEKSHLKPAIYIDANIHAGEVTGMMSALYTMDALCTGYQKDKKIQHILSQYTFYIIPMVSPDGVDAYLNKSEKLRSVNQNYPFETKQKGLHPKDIDEDGAIRMMRIKSKFGTWKISDKDSRMMTKRLPNDINGTYYHVFPEGEVIGYDGLNIELAPNKWGLDYNRNFPFAWFSESRQNGAGLYPLSNIETKAIAQFVLDKKNIGFVHTLHTTGGVFIYPPGTKSEKDAYKQDMKIFHDLGKVAFEKTGYKTENVFDAFLTDTVNYSSGAFDDWCYETQGIPAFTVELWNLLERAGIVHEEIRETYKDNTKGEAAYLKVLKWIDENTDTDTFKPWTTFNHPSLGTVEIGGFDSRFILQNPPPKFLKQEVEKIGAYLIDASLSLPKLSIENVTVQKIEESLSKIEITIGNTGYLSTTLTQKMIDEKKNTPITITISENDINNTNKKTIDNLHGYGAINSQYGYDGIATVGAINQVEKVTFLVNTKDKSSLTVTASHPIAGVVSVDLDV